MSLLLDFVELKELTTLQGYSAVNWWLTYSSKDRAFASIRNDKTTHLWQLNG